MRRITTAGAISLVAVSLLVAAPASASQFPLYRAATEYREAVRHFERTVLRARCFDRQDERLVDRLEDASSLLIRAARRPSYRQRLVITWSEIQVLQKLVANAIFGHPRCPAGRELTVGWDRVVHAGAEFAAQLALIPWEVSGYGVPICPIYYVPHHHHHHDHGQPTSPKPSPTPLPYWHPSRTPYGQGVSVPKTDRVISAPDPVPGNDPDVRKITPSPQKPQSIQIQRTQHVPTSRGISKTPSQRTLGSAKTGAKLMRR